MVNGVGRRMGVLDGGGNRRREGTVSGFNVGYPIITNGDFVALFSAVRGGDAAPPNYFEISCLKHHTNIRRTSQQTM